MEIPSRIWSFIIHKKCKRNIEKGNYTVIRKLYQCFNKKTIYINFSFFSATKGLQGRKDNPFVVLSDVPSQNLSKIPYRFSNKSYVFHVREEQSYINFINTETNAVSFNEITPRLFP